jgi:hypothetical protein
VKDVFSVALAVLESAVLQAFEVVGATEDVLEVAAKEIFLADEKA